MASRILDGRALAAEVQVELSARSAALAALTGAAPGLAIVRVGDGGSTTTYARSVTRAAQRAGIDAREHVLPGDAGASELAALIGRLNDDPHTAGIVVAQPLPPDLATHDLLDLIDPARDVDGATSINAGRLARGQPAMVPATALAVMEILRRTEIEVAGRRAVVVGRSPVIGRPVASLLIAADATVTVCHRRTPDLAAECHRAEILVVAAGSPGLIGPDAVAEAAVVIDCGINAVAGGIVGDVDFLAVVGRTSAITPVPGGVGPVTAVMLASQTLDAAERLAADSRHEGRAGG